MPILSSLISFLMALLLAACCTIHPKKVAVLVVAERADVPLLPNNSEFWHDTVLTYCMLRTNGFKDENIYVLYGDGEDGYAIPYGALLDQEFQNPADYYQKSPNGYCNLKSLDEKITDFPVTFFRPASKSKTEGVLGCGEHSELGWACRNPVCSPNTSGAWQCAPKHVLECLGTGCDVPKLEALFGCSGCVGRRIDALEEDDYLFFWWKGHGKAVDGDPNTYELRLGGDLVSASDVVGWMAGIKARDRTFSFETCKSGCLTLPGGNVFGEPAGPREVALLSSGCDQDSSLGLPSFGGYEHLHSPWTFWVAGTLRGAVPDFAGAALVGSPFEGSPSDPASGTYVIGTCGGPLLEVFKQSAVALKGQVDPNYQKPRLEDPLDLAPHTRIDVKDPGKEVTASKNQD